MPSKRQWKWTVLSLEFPIPAFIGRKSKQNIPQTSVSTLDYNLESSPYIAHSVRNGMGKIVENILCVLDIFVIYYMKSRRLKM